ncbi:cAMP and cAMP-inhibited cGMP 3, 5 -cyclic phosphodiesterase 10A, partial [Paramuricea clavata]
MQRQKNLHNFLLDVIKSLFDEMDTVDGVITNVMTYAKRLVEADRCAMFLTDEKTNELHADLFDEGKLDENGCAFFSKGKEIRFSSEKGIAGYVATSGKLLNIKDAYSDPRFNREVDVKTGYTTHTILCVPMTCKDSVVGVVQLINKRKGIFTSADEHAFTLFAGYCGLAIRYSQ